MDVETINKISLLVPPLYLNSEKCVNKDVSTNSIAVSTFGDVVILSDKGGVVFIPIRPLPVTNTFSSSSAAATQQEDYHELPFENDSDRDAIRQCQFTGVSFNRDSSAIILWSSHSIGVVEIPRSLMLNGSIDPYYKKGGKKCVFYNLSKLVNLNKQTELLHSNNNTNNNNNNNNNNSNSMKLLKVKCHPWSSHHIVTLQDKGPLSVIDIVNQTVQTIPLSGRYTFTSFCFGPDVDWMAVSVLLVTDTSDIFAVCPILPRGCPVAAKTANAMTDWLEEQERCVIELAQGSQRRGGSYFERAWQYCNEAFGGTVNNVNSPFDGGSKRYGNESGEKRQKNVSKSVFAGNSKENSMLKSQGVSEDILNANSMFITTPKLQGPFSIACVPNANRKEEKEKKGIIACDICTPKGNNNGNDGVPIVNVSYSNGLVEMFIFRSDVNESFYVSPSWLHCTNAVLRPAELLFVEGLGGSDSCSDTWTVDSDPVFNHIFHITNRTMCASYLLSSPWISKAVEDDNMSKNSRKGNDTYSSLEVEKTGSLILTTSILIPTTSLQPSLLTPVFTPSAAGPIIGSAIIYDPMIGHISLFRKSDGKIAAINLTVHMRLCELQKALKKCDESGGAFASFTNDLDSLVGRQDMAREREISQLCSICDGLYNIPTYSSDVGTPQGSKEMASVVEHLESSVLLPLEELSLRMHMRLESLQEAWTIQHDLVMGGPRGGGLIAELQGLQEGSRILRERIAAINRRFEEQKNDVENNSSLVYLTKSKVSKAERDYYRQLKEWEGQIEKMNCALEPLQTLARSTLSSSRGQQSTFRGHLPISSGSPAAFMRQRLNSNLLTSPNPNPHLNPSNPVSAITPSKVLKSSALTPSSKSIHGSSNPMGSAAKASADRAIKTPPPAKKLNISKETIEKCNILLEAQERSIRELAAELNALELSAHRR